jgi:hypothetical protein
MVLPPIYISQIFKIDLISIGPEVAHPKLVSKRPRRNNLSRNPLIHLQELEPLAHAGDVVPQGRHRRPHYVASVKRPSRDGCLERSADDAGDLPKKVVGHAVLGKIIRADCREC